MVFPKKGSLCFPGSLRKKNLLLVDMGWTACSKQGALSLVCLDPAKKCQPPPNGWPVAGTSILGKTMSLYV